MSNLHNERPGKGVMYWEEESQRKNDKAPDFKGFLVLEMDYKAGEKLKLAAWKKPTSRGYELISLSEDNWSKKQREQHKEVEPAYNKVTHKRFDDDNEIPFWCWYFLSRHLWTPTGETSEGEPFYRKREGNTN